MDTFISFAGRKRQLLSNTARKAEFNEIPIISLGAPENEMIEQLRYACTTVGFFYIRDHDVPQSIIDDTFSCAQDFFSLSPEAKDEIHFTKSAILRGYEPMALVRTDETKAPDLNEAFSYGYEPGLDPKFDADEAAYYETLQGNAMQGPNVWPSRAGFKQSVAAYYGEILSLARRMIRLFAAVLDLPTDYFDDMIKHPGAMVRLIHYPPQPVSNPDALGIGAHTDIECFTILCQGSQPALQILNVNGEWIEAPPIPGTFVVNIGDMLARWSNDVLISTVHRVLNVTGEERYSIPFFFGPSYDTTIEPLGTCIKDGEESKYDPITAGDYVYRRLAKSRL